MGNSQSGIPAETNEEERGETRKAEGLGTVLSHDRSVAEEEGTPATGGATSGEQHDGMAHHIDEEHSRMNTFITEDQVQVNLAMADLMAYLQVVANNSTNLPLTRRDDSEMQKVVANITSEEYACKAAAFIPADVRVIGGSFTRYGRVWDLPTMEEYTAIDGALEPGRSYGGACSNTFLKVLYDAATEKQMERNHGKGTEALFDDEDDDEEEASAWMGKSFKSGYSLDKNASQLSTPSWAQILRSMKAEMNNIEYAQVPKVTTSRKFDLNKQFSFVQDDFDPKRGKKRALLIGCNYNNVTGAELKASHDDVMSMRDYIVNVHGFEENPSQMTILMDDGDHNPPTFMNIIDAFKSLSERSQPGDAVFVMFAGHGGRILSEDSDEDEAKYDETIAPSDYETAGLIRDTLIFKTLLAPMRYGVTLTIMIDCCDNGMLMELPYSWSTKFDRKESFARLTLNEDFSFLRFLKVVRTLYENSSFTQLGKTVGSALHSETVEFGQDTNPTDMDVFSDHEDEREESARPSIFDAIAEACTTDNFREKPEEREALSPTYQEGNSFGFRQVLNCSILNHPEDEYMSEEDMSDHSGDIYEKKKRQSRDAGIQKKKRRSVGRRERRRQRSSRGH